MAERAFFRAGRGYDRKGLEGGASDTSFAELFYRLRPQLGWPWWLGALLLGAALALMTRSLRRRGRLDGPQAAAAVVLGAYLFLVFSYTVFSRTPREGYAYELSLFWSWEIIRAGGREFLVEGLYNTLMLVPLGLLLPVLLARPGRRAVGLRTVALGLLCSAVIEGLQLILRLGLFECDDLLHNTLGAALGCGLYYLIRALRTKKSEPFS